MTGYEDQYEKTLHADEATASGMQEDADTTAEKAYADAAAGQDEANVAAAGEDVKAHAADLETAVSVTAPADKGFWDAEAGFQEEEDVSDAGAAQTMDDTVAGAYDTAVQTWSQQQATPWAKEQADFADADTNWVEQVAGAQVTDVQQTDNAMVAWTGQVDSAAETQATDDVASVKAQSNYDDTVAGEWAQEVESQENPNDPLSEYDGQVAAAEAGQVESDDAALVQEANGVTDANVGQSDGQETAVVGLAEGIANAQSGETETTSGEEAAAIGTAADDVAAAVGEYAQAQATLIKSAAAAIMGGPTPGDPAQPEGGGGQSPSGSPGGSNTATVNADVKYDNSVAANGEQFVDTVAPAAAALYVAQYTPGAWTAYSQIQQSAAQTEQSNDQQANVQRVDDIGTGEENEAGGLGAAQQALATAAGRLRPGWPKVR